MKNFYLHQYLLLLFFLAPLAALNTVSAQTVVFSENCNALGGWTNSGAIYPSGITGSQYNWHAVVPFVPPADHTGGGGGVFYTNGNSLYMQAGALNYVIYQLKSPAINLTGWDNTRLEFWMQLRSETNNWDGAYIEWSPDGVNWTLINMPNMCMPYDGNMSQNPSSTPYYPYLHPAWWNPRLVWTRMLINTSAWDNIPTFYLRFTFHSDEALAAEGWALDDISIISVAIPQVEGNNVIINHNDLTPSIPDGTDFGAVPIGQCATQTFYMHNIGESPLTLTGNPYVQITGSTDFTVLSQPANNVIPAGDSVAFQVQFCPTVIGNATAQISIPNSDNYSSCSPPNPYKFGISGRNLNTPPVIAGLHDTTLCTNSGPVSFNVTLSDIEQNVNVLTLSGVSSNQAVVPNANITFTGVGANRTVTVTPVQQGGAVITITASDGQAYNPDSNFTFTVNFGDTIAPTALCQNLTVQLNALGQGSITAQQADAGSTDNCGINQITVSQSNFTCADAGVVQVDLIVEDIAGNISTCTFDVTVIPPALSATYTTSDYNSYQVSCFGASDGSITVTPNGGCPPVDYIWGHDPNLNAATANGLTAGNYTVTVQDAAGQQVDLQITLTEPPALADQSVVTDISCFGEQDGRIDLDVTGGVPPYAYPSGNTQVTGLSAGNYNYSITDANNCNIDVAYVINEPPEIFLSGTDFYAVFCKEEVLLDITANGGTGQLAFAWNPPANLSCSDCEDPIATAPKSTVYTVTVTDERLCSELMPVTVDVSCYAFIPNTFTPNEDGLNDVFYVESGALESLEMRVFSRWGEEVFFSQKLDYGWNGKKYNNGKELPVGIYCYAIEITLPGQQPVVYRGNVNLVR